MLVGLTAGCAIAAKAHYVPDAPVLPGLSIDGQPVSEGATADDVSALVDARASDLLRERITLSLPGEAAPALEATLEELGVRVDTERTSAVALRAGKRGDLVTRAEAARAAREGRTDIPLFAYVDRDVAMTRLLALKEAKDAQPVSARLDIENRRTIPEQEGRYIDADETIGALERAVQTRQLGTLTLAVQSFPPRISSEFLQNLDIGTVVAEYETHFSRGGEQSRRGKNIDLAAQRLNGLVISPGELVSFNEVVGERTEANGFEKSWEIFRGEMVEGVGGGTCQVSSTLYAASFFGGLEVLERLPHSRPSVYIPMGLDATVVYPAVDLKVRNPYPFPVAVHAKTIGNKLRIELLGRAKPVRVRFEREVVATIPYKRKVEEDPSLSRNRVVVKQHGIQGYRIKRARISTFSDGTERREEESDAYPATTEIYRVPVGFDVALLPPLPGGESEDPDLGGNPAAAPPGSGAPARPGELTAALAPPPEIEFVDARGASAPTAAQRAPDKKMTLRR